MKKRIILPAPLFCLLFLLLALSTSIYAQEPTPKIKIGDISVFESTDSIVGESIQGHVSFDASSNTLFLNNATISSSLWVYNADTSFKVKLSGNNSINEMISSNATSIFFGPGSLTLGNSTVEIALQCARTDFLILTEGATLDITASDAGIFTLYDYIWDSIVHYPNLVIDNSDLIISAPNCCLFVWNWWLSGCHVVEPVDFEYQLDTWTFLSTGSIHNYLEIRKGTVGLPENEAFRLKAWGVEGGIRIEGMEEDCSVEVVNMLGQVVYRATAPESAVFIPLKQGAYVVRAGNGVVKTVVK